MSHMSYFLTLRRKRKKDLVYISKDEIGPFSLSPLDLHIYTYKSNKND